MYRELIKGMCAELEEALLGIDEARLSQLVDALLGAKRIFVAGAGRTGLLMKSMAMTLAQCGLRWRRWGRSPPMPSERGICW